MRDVSLSGLIFGVDLLMRCAFLWEGSIFSEVFLGGLCFGVFFWERWCA